MIGMLNEKKERELAYVVKVDEIRPIEGADRVEIAVVNGWHIMVRKDQFKPGDLAVYFEIDSKVPAKEPFMFLEGKHFKVKTQKYFKGTVISQGLLMGFEDFGWDKNAHKLGDFLTKELEVTYSVEEDNIRKAPSVDKYKRMAQRNGKLFVHQPFRWLMRRTWGKKLLFVFFGKKGDKKATWPAWVAKTDEERVENMPWIFDNKSPFVATEKIDGTSTTFTMKRGKFGKNNFYVCSRNVVFDKPDKNCFYDTNVYIEMAEKYDIEKILESILTDDPTLDWVTLQGETYGAGIQKRDYGLKEHRFAGFNFITSKEGRWDSVRAAKFMTQYNIPWVPILDENYILPDTIEELRAFSHSEGSRIDGVIKEGIVFRSQDGSMSFKCVDPEFLMKYHA
jgi:hypothetical protein